VSHQRRNRRAQISHTDDWLLTYADTITLLFCLFVVLASQAHKPRLAPDPMPAVPVEQTVAPANFIDWKPPFKPTTLGNEAADEDAHAEAEDRTTPTPVENPLLSSAPRDAPPAAERTIIVDPLDERSAAALSGSVSLAALPALADVAPQQPSDAPLIPLPEIVAHVRPEGAAHLEQKGDRITTLAFESAAFFSRGTATLNGSGKVILQEVVGNLKSEEYQDYMVTIEGHTDDAPINTAQFPSNWELSTARAAAVVRFFVEQGVSAQRLRAAGYADTHPLQPNRDSNGIAILENQAKNRRVVIGLEKIERR
jgi:chemotaxis protein MotB